MIAMIFIAAGLLGLATALLGHGLRSLNAYCSDSGSATDSSARRIAISLHSVSFHSGAAPFAIEDEGDDWWGDFLCDIRVTDVALAIIAFLLAAIGLWQGCAARRPPPATRRWRPRTRPPPCASWSNASIGANDMERLQWSPTHETGVAEIDEDHRKLFALADAIYVGVTTRDATLTAHQVQSFIDACKTHFAWEESVLARAGFPGLEGHKVYHTSLLAKADELRRACDVEIDLDKAQACYQEVIAFLIDDVLRGDVEFNSYLAYFKGGRQKA